MTIVDDDRQQATEAVGGARAQRLLEIEGLSKTYSSRRGTVRAVDSITFDVSVGEFVCVVGPSGCGKTTLMNCIAGLNPLSEGSVRFEGEVITGPPEDLAVVFQDYSRSLFPWLTCAKNVALGLQGSKLGRREIKAKVEESLAVVGLAGVEDLFPWQLSGGMQQRVAIARGLALSPALLIMDEPFASVDAQTRVNLEDLTLQVWSELNMTILFVTHDIDEAVYLADRVVVLSQGPSVVREEIVVDLPRPRDQLETKKHPVFAELRAEVFGLVMDSQERSGIVERKRQ